MFDTTKYRDYLASDGWRARSRDLRARFPMCQVCRRERSTEVHHRTYQRLGAESDEDLVAVCSLCHEAISCLAEVVTPSCAEDADASRQMAETVLRRRFGSSTIEAVDALLEPAPPPPVLGRLEELDRMIFVAEADERPALFAEKRELLNTRVESYRSKALQAQCEPRF
jgi:hypothetical protein